MAFSALAWLSLSDNTYGSLYAAIRVRKYIKLSWGMREAYWRESNGRVSVVCADIPI